MLRALFIALKDQPALLALVVTDFALLVFIFYALHSAASFREDLVTQVISSARSSACPDVK